LNFLPGHFFSQDGRYSFQLFAELRVDWCCESGMYPIALNAASRLRNGSCETMTLPLDGALSRGFCEVGVWLVFFNLKTDF